MNGIHALNSTFDYLNNSLNLFGFNFPKFDLRDSRCFKYMENLEEDELFQINASLLSYNDLINDGPLPNETDGSQNKRYLQKFLNKFELDLSPKFLNDIIDGHIIEVYSKSHKQIYRSINFFSSSSYDLGALTFTPWDKLFYRPEEETNKLLKAANYTLENNIDYMTPNIPTHFLTELCSEKIFGYKLIKIGCVYDSVSFYPMGYVTIISVKEVLGTFKVIH